MPGPVSSVYRGPRDSDPYVPSWCYPKGKPRICPCGCHEGYHDEEGYCLRAALCQCQGLPPECLTPDEDMPDV